MVPGLVLIHDSVQQRLTIVCNVWKQGATDAGELYQQACDRIEAIIARLKGPIPASCLTQARPTAAHQFTSNMDLAGFSAMVEQAKE